MLTRRAERSGGIGDGLVPGSSAQNGSVTEAVIPTVPATVILRGHRFGLLATTVLAGWGVYRLVLEEVDDGGAAPSGRTTG